MNGDFNNRDYYSLYAISFLLCIDLIASINIIADIKLLDKYNIEFSLFTETAVRIAQITLLLQICNQLNTIAYGICIAIEIINLTLQIYFKDNDSAIVRAMSNMSLFVAFGASFKIAATMQQLLWFVVILGVQNIIDGMDIPDRLSLYYLYYN